MDKKEDLKPFSHPRWTEVPVPEFIGTIEQTEEQMQKSREKLEALIKEWHGTK